MKDKVITAFKGFDAEFKCRGYQYKVGETYTHNGKVSLCNEGFHACENPLDVLAFYGMENGNRFASVEMSGEFSSKKDDDNSKLCSAKIHITAELSLPEFIKSAITYVFELLDFDKVTKSDTETSSSKYKAKLAASGHYSQLAASGDSSKLAASGDSSKLAASGHYSQLAASGDSSKLAASGHSSKLAASGHSSKLAASGDSSKLAASGDYSKLAASGDYSQLAASGHHSQLAASGHHSQLAASGHHSQLAASGDSSQLAASGDSSQLAASGHYSQLAASGHYSTIASSAVNGVAKGPIGTWISLAEYEYNKENRWECIGFATGKVDGKTIPADVYLKAKGGKLVKAGQG